MPTGFSYNFKFWQELGWMVLIAILVTVFQALLGFDAAGIADWRVWAISLFSAIVRAVAAVVIAGLGGKLSVTT